MTENELFKNLRDFILSQSIRPDIEVKRAYQSTQQGNDANPSVYFHLVSQVPYGFSSKSQVEENGNLIQTESQQYNSVIQLSALIEESPNTEYRTVDLINDIRFIVQSELAINWLNEKGMSLLRVDSIRNSYVTDNQERYQPFPSFDLTIITTKTKVYEVPIVNSFQFKKYRV